jgi:hypothetical protein
MCVLSQHHHIVRAVMRGLVSPQRGYGVRKEKLQNRQSMCEEMDGQRILALRGRGTFAAALSRYRN